MILPLTRDALTGGHHRKLIVADDERVGFFAILHFGEEASVGSAGTTPEAALQGLEVELLVQQEAVKILKRAFP